jgi:hypothetical protein
LRKYFTEENVNKTCGGKCRPVNLKILKQGDFAFLALAKLCDFIKNWESKIKVICSVQNSEKF